MKKFKKVLALSLALAMGLSLAACGGSSDSGNSGNSGSGDSGNASSNNGGSSDNGGATDNGGSTDNGGAATGNGETFYIYVWNNEFRNLMANYMPGYTADDDHMGGYMEDGTRIQFIENENSGLNYQTKLSTAIADGEQVDMFLVEADYAVKYTSADAGVAMDIKDLGFTDDDLATMYDYAKNVVTDGGVTRGVSWQCAPGFFAYRRDIAEAVWGQSDPEFVQSKLDSWENFDKAAEELKAKDYAIVAEYQEGSRAANAGRSSAWVTDGVITVPKEIEEWTERAKGWYDNGYMLGGKAWDAAGNWGKGMKSDGNVFGYFACSWFLNFSMAEQVEGDATWAFCQGPVPYYWGGTWLCAGSNCTNTQLAYDIMWNMTCNVDILKEMAVKEMNFANNKKAMEEVAKDFTPDPKYSWIDLGDDNYFNMCLDLAEAIEVKNMTGYDQMIENYQDAMSDYFNGTSSKDDALKNFYNAVTEKWTELSAPQ